jgi:HD-like signal output (HDOD) protein
VSASPTRSILILETGGGVGPLLAKAIGSRYPEWEVAAVDAAAAAGVMNAGAVDAVVPIVGTGGNGAAQIEWIRRTYPDVRHVAAEISGPAALQNAAATAILVEDVARSLVIRDRIDDFQLVAFTAELKRIPVVSSVYQEICKMLAYDPGAGDYSLADVAELVGQDPGIAARVLKLINSAVFGLPRPVTSILQAVALLGARRMATLMMWVSLNDQLRVGGAAGRAVERDWNNARVVAHLSREIAAYEGLGQDQAEEAYLAGLMHNVGRLVLAANVGDQFAAVEWPSTTFEQLDLEQQHIGVRHTDLGALLMRFWGLEDRLAEAVGFYADPVAGASRRFGPLAAVHGAVVLLGQGGLDWDRDFLEAAGLEQRPELWAKLKHVSRLAAVAG